MHIAHDVAGRDVQASYYQLSDAVLSYTAHDNRWTGTWVDGQPMAPGVAEAIADVEDLRWPDGQPK